MASFIRPPRLRPGATIGIAAVSGPVPADRLAAGVRALETLGYRVRLAANVDDRVGFLAGSDEQRAAGYRALLADRTVDAIFFARGGYGASRVLRHLAVQELRARPLIHLGASDLTALFCFLAVHARLVCFYGPMPAVSMGSEEGLDWQRVLSGQPPAPHPIRAEDVLTPGVGAGPLVGGCLSLLASLAGTPEAVSAKGSVLFWEDVGEEAYRMDRMLTQLERSGTFDGLQGMIVGSISPGARGGDESLQTVGAWLRDRFAGAPFPVVRGLPAGHLSRPRTLPLGVPVKLDTEGGSLEFSEAGVE